MTSVDSLDRYISDALKVEEEEPEEVVEAAARPRLASPPTERLLQITEALKSSLRALLGLMQEEDEQDEDGPEFPWMRHADNLAADIRSRPTSFLSLGSDSVGGDFETSRPPNLE